MNELKVELVDISGQQPKYGWKGEVLNLTAVIDLTGVINRNPHHPWILCATRNGQEVGRVILS